MIDEKKHNNEQTRSEMLARIREQLAASRSIEAERHEDPVHEQKTSILVDETSFIENAPIAFSINSGANSLAERFRENLEAIGGNCQIVQDTGQAAEIIEKIIQSINARRVAISDSGLVRETIDLLKTKVELLENASASALFDCDLGITGAQRAIAETGTLVLESEKEFNRLTSLVPPIHVCLIEAEFIHQSLGEILNLLNQNGSDKLSRTVTFITGPSRTSDIELTLAIGVHGPAELHVIIIETSSQARAEQGRNH